jgi:hypothetical protein
VARERVARLTRKSGINLLPIVLFVIAAAIAGAGLFTWDYLWRKKQEEANRPPPPDVVVRNLVENIIGPDTVKEAKIDVATGTVTVTFESATFKPEQPPKDSREFLSAEAKLAADVLLRPPPQLVAAVPPLGQVKQVNLTIVYKGATLATATTQKGEKDVQVTYVDPRVK